MIEVYIEVENGAPEADWVERVASAVIQHETQRDPGDLTLVLVDDAEIQRLNLTFLNHDRPTDVIAFPLEDDEDTVWGEVYVSVERAKAQAAEFGVPLDHELARLLVHGVLHLLDYDDLTAEGKAAMTAREDHYLRQFLAQGLISPPQAPS